MGGFYFSRPGRAGKADMLVRTPELEPLREKAISVFGLGCIGAPSALELARAGVGGLRILDHDFIDPATVARWPFGLSVAGLPKASVVASFIAQNYPSTKVDAVIHRLGAVRMSPEAHSDSDVLRQMTEGTSLIYDATAELGVQHVLTDYAKEKGIPYVGVVGMDGGWGGKVFRIVPNRTAGCWYCYRCACDDGSIVDPPSAPDGQVQPLGCGDPTFTGAGFDMAQIALTGVRAAVSTLCASHEHGYPDAEWDVLTIAFRNRAGEPVVPLFRGYKLTRHFKCPHCSAT